MTGAPERHRVAPKAKPKKIIRPAIVEEPEAGTKKPTAKATRPKTGHAAAMAEYRYYKAIGGLAFWRAKWRHVLGLH